MANLGNIEGANQQIADTLRSNANLVLSADCRPSREIDTGDDDSSICIVCDKPCENEAAWCDANEIHYNCDRITIGEVEAMENSSDPYSFKGCIRSIKIDED